MNAPAIRMIKGTHVCVILMSVSTALGTGVALMHTCRASNTPMRAPTWKNIAVTSHLREDVKASQFFPEKASLLC